MGRTCCDSQMTAATTNRDDTWSFKKMEEGDNGLNTLECLRGRLLAERHASRLAKEEAESMTNKFVELERELKEEIKLRDKAERKLKFLKKKLESFNMSSSSGQSYSSQKCENSCGSSSCSSASRNSEGNETNSCIANPALLENAVHNHNVAEACVIIQTHNNSPSSSFKNPNQSSDDYNSNPSPSHASTENICHNPNPSPSNESRYYIRLFSLSSKSSSVIGNENDHEDFVDNSLALVPVTLQATSKVTSNHKPVNESVVEALDALRRARERLLCSMGTRPMIKVGPN